MCEWDRNNDFRHTIHDDEPSGVHWQLKRTKMTRTKWSKMKHNLRATNIFFMLGFWAHFNVAILGESETKTHQNYRHKNLQTGMERSKTNVFRQQQQTYRSESKKGTLQEIQRTVETYKRTITDTSEQTVFNSVAFGALKRRNAFRKNYLFYAWLLNSFFMSCIHFLCGDPDSHLKWFESVNRCVGYLAHFPLSNQSRSYASQPERNLAGHLPKCFFGTSVWCCPSATVLPAHFREMEHFRDAQATSIILIAS